MEHKNLDIFSIRLKEEREHAKLSQAELAQILDIPQSTYASYELIGERHGRLPPIYIVRKICTTLNISANYLLGIEDLK